MEMRYDLATNFDNKLIEKVAPFGIVKCLYGMLSEHIIGGGRPSFTIPNISQKQLKGHIKTAHEHGIKFNYLFNALCSDNREFSGKTNLQIRDFIKHIQDTGADIVTVGSPFMLKLAKNTAPDLEISVSVYNDIDSLERIRAWEELGADELTLHYGFNRNFKKLEQALKSTDLNLRLIANNTCLHDCIYRTNHANALAHSSQSNHESGGFFLDFYSLNCGKEKFESSGKFIAADWIRPEDVHYYEELCDKIGKTNLTLKLTERSRPTDWLVRVVKAYAEKSYDGNLFDILNYRNNEFTQVNRTPFIKGAILGKARAQKMRNMQEAIFPAQVYLNNKDLDGFIEPFIKGKDCSEHICDISELKNEKKNANSCSYCKDIAEKHLKFVGGDKARENCLKKAINSLEDLERGSMFKK
ncbi:MAG: U32 family peptidase [Candidatus Nanoarchaeia archaeon]|nr:U32 family peptidase [Candidatus Nanoarchaeia archaeon]MDD5740503.1 U32 family peptidase [Candidatus Nanoarchaeia archaeon]